MKAMTAEQLIEITELSINKIDDFIEQGMPTIEKDGEIFYPLISIDWLIKNHLKIDDELEKNIVLNAWKKGLNLNEIK